METFKQLQSVWNMADTSKLPKADLVFTEITKFQRTTLRKKWLTVFFALLTAGIMVAVLLIVDFHMLSTYIGGIAIALACFIMAFMNIKSMKRFNQLSNPNNVEFLAFVEQTRQKQIYYYKKTQFRMMIFCLSGLFCYLYEPFVKNPIAATLLFSISTCFYLFIWIWVRPRQLKKDIEKLNAVCARLETIYNQLK